MTVQLTRHAEPTLHTNAFKAKSSKQGSSALSTLSNFIDSCSSLKGALVAIGSTLAYFALTLHKSEQEEFTSPLLDKAVSTVLEHPKALFNLGLVTVALLRAHSMMSNTTLFDKMGMSKSTMIPDSGALSNSSGILGRVHFGRFNELRFVNIEGEVNPYYKARLPFRSLVRSVS